MKRKFKMFLKHCPFVIMLILTSFILSGIGVYGVIIGKYKDKITFKHPVLSFVLVKKEEKEIKLNEKKEYNIVKDEDIENISPTVSEVVVQTKKIVPRYIKRDPVTVRSEYYDDPQVTALTTEYNYHLVEDSYFDDALFIGDSRIEGLASYSGLNAAFLSKVGLSVYKMMTEELNYGDEKIKLPDLLEKKSFNKIYIMIGINELGSGGPANFAEKYKENLDEIIRLNPNAVITILAIMNVTTEYSDESNVYNNDNINSRNVAISEFADGDKIFYLDVNPSICDETGGMNLDYSLDGVHLRAEYYKLWVDYMKNYGH